MKSNVAREIIIQNTPEAVFAKRALFQINLKPLKKGDNSFQNTDFFETSGAYTLKCKSGRSAYEDEIRPYVLNVDIFPCNRLRVADYNDLLKKAEENERIRFIVENTNISKELFEVAKENQFLPLAFSLDVVKVVNKIKANSPDRELKKNYLMGG